MADTDPSPELLFGVMALRAGLVDSEQFAATCQRWFRHREQSIFACFAEHGDLQPADQGPLNYLVERALARHGGDATAALRDSADVGVWRSLAQLHDRDLRRWLEGVLPGAAWLEHEPRAPRRGLAVLGLLLLLLLGIAGLGGVFVLVGSVFWLRGTHQAEMVARMQAEEARAAAAEMQIMARRQAEANLQAAQLAVTDEQLLADEALAKPLDEARRKQLEQALVRLESTVRNLEQDPAKGAGLAESYRKLALIHEHLGQPERALTAGQKALALLQAQSSDTPADATGMRQRQAAAQQHLARLYRKAERPRDAEDAGRQAIDLFVKLVQDAPGTLEDRNGLINSLLERGELLRTQGRPAEAEQALRRAIALLEKLAADFPKQAEVTTRLDAARKRLVEVGKQEKDD